MVSCLEEERQGGSGVWSVVASPTHSTRRRVESSESVKQQRNKKAAAAKRAFVQNKLGIPKLDSTE